MEETVFSKIIRREIPAEIVYEDDDVMAFLDITPDREGHTLIVPKIFARNIFDIEEALFLKIMQTGFRLAPKIRDAVGAQGVRLSINNEPAGGQKVMHLHLHVIPHPENDPPVFSPPHGATPEELAKTAQKIRAALND